MARKQQSKTTKPPETVEAEILSPVKNQKQKPDKQNNPSPVIDMGKGEGASSLFTFGGVLVAIVIGSVMGFLAAFATPYILQATGVSEKPEKLIAQQLAPLAAALEEAKNNNARINAALNLFEDTSNRVSRLEGQDDLRAATSLLEEKIQQLSDAQNAHQRQQETLDYAVLALRQRMSAIEQQKPAALPVLKSAVLASLTHALHAGQPYQIELLAYRQHVLNPQEQTLTDALGASADTGIQTSEDLRMMFARLMPKLSALTIQLAIRSPEGGMMARLQRSLAQIIRIKRQANPEDKNSPEAVIKQISNLLSTGQQSTHLREALVLSQSLPAAYQPFIKNWQAQIRAHLAAEDILAQLAVTIGLMPYHSFHKGGTQ